jgi:hypothetical protein
MRHGRYLHGRPIQLTYLRKGLHGQPHHLLLDHGQPLLPRTVHNLRTELLQGRLRPLPNLIPIAAIQQRRIRLKLSHIANPHNHLHQPQPAIHIIPHHLADRLLPTLIILVGLVYVVVGVVGVFLLEFLGAAGKQRFEEL